MTTLLLNSWSRHPHSHLSHRTHLRLRSRLILDLGMKFALNSFHFGIPTNFHLHHHPHYHHLSCLTLMTTMNVVVVVHLTFVIVMLLMDYLEFISFQTFQLLLLRYLRFPSRLLLLPSLLPQNQNLKLIRAQLNHELLTPKTGSPHYSMNLNPNHRHPHSLNYLQTSCLNLMAHWGVWSYHHLTT